MRYAFIEQHCDSYPLQMLCTALQVSDSGFTSWQRSDGPKKWLSDGELLKRIREIHEETKAAYGSPRIYQELKGCGIPVSKGRVERLMREDGLRGRHKRRFKATTDSKHTLPVAEQLGAKAADVAAHLPVFFVDCLGFCQQFCGDLAGMFAAQAHRDPFHARIRGRAAFGLERPWLRDLQICRRQPTPYERAAALAR